MTEEFRLLHYHVSYQMERKRRFIFSKKLKEKELNKIIDIAAADTGFTKWLENYDLHHKNRVLFRGRSKYIVLQGLIFFDTPYKATIGFLEENIFYFLDDPNDLDEWISFVKTSYTFCKRLSELLPTPLVIWDGLRDYVLKNLLELKVLAQTLEEKGIIFHISQQHLPKRVIIKNNSDPNSVFLSTTSTKICLLKDHETPEELIVSQPPKALTPELPENYILINCINLKHKLEHQIPDLYKAIKDSSLSSLYYESWPLPRYDKKSYDYSVDLSWNDETKSRMYSLDEYELFRSYDGYIARNRSSGEPEQVHYFRPSIRELKDVIKSFC